jgi:hypothetical protein
LKRFEANKKIKDGIDEGIQVTDLDEYGTY